MKTPEQELNEAIEYADYMLKEVRLHKDGRPDLTEDLHLYVLREAAISIRAASTPSAEVQLKNEKFMRKEYFLETVNLTNEVQALRLALEKISRMSTLPDKICNTYTLAAARMIAQEALNQTSKSVINKVGEKS